MADIEGDLTLWKRKIATFFTVVDFNHNGALTQADMEGLASRYIELGKLGELEAKKVRRKLIQIYQDYADDSPMNCEAFIESFQRKSTKDMIKTATQYFGLFFDLIDINGDGVVTREEYALFAKALQLSDEAAEVSFSAIDTDKDGKISHDEYVAAGVDFYVTNDETSPFNLFWGPLVD